MNTKLALWRNLKGQLSIFGGMDIVLGKVLFLCSVQVDMNVNE